MSELITLLLGIGIGFNGALALALYYTTKKAVNLTETLKHDWELRQIAERNQAKLPNIPYYNGLGKIYTDSTVPPGMIYGLGAQSMSSS